MDREEQELYQSIITDHDDHPRNYQVLEGATHTVEVYNPICGDRYTIYILLADERIERLTFTGQGCAISRASASIMSTLVCGLPLGQAESLGRAVEQFVASGDAPGGFEMGDLIALRGVHRFPTRRTCALLAWSALKKSFADGRG